jgi:hypothetical protein
VIVTQLRKWPTETRKCGTEENGNVKAGESGLRVFGEKEAIGLGEEIDRFGEKEPIGLGQKRAGGRNHLRVT